MTRRRAIVLALLCTLLIAGGVAFGQRFGQFRGGRPGVIPDDRAGVPNWKVDEQFKKDVFTFVRIEYDSCRPGEVAAGAASVAVRRRLWLRPWLGSSGRPIFPTATSISRSGSSN